MRSRSVSDEEALGILEDDGRKISEEDVRQVIRKEEEINRKFHGPLAKFLLDARTLFALIKDYWNKQYREVPWWTIGAATAALLYVLNPMDIVPDFIPVVGLVDDAAIVSACLFMLDRDLVRYRLWKKTARTEDE